MKPVMVLIALLSAAFIVHLSPARAQINNSTPRTKVQAVQAKLPRKEATDVKVEEKAQTEQQAVVEPEIVREAAAVETPTPQPLTDHESLMQAAGISADDFNATNYIVSNESSWCYKRMNGDHRPCDTIPQPSLDSIGSRAYGMCQALPASKMSSEGADYLTNPVTQLRWCSKYAGERYGSWWSSFAFWQSNKWW